jgi:hypothetical protein
MARIAELPDRIITGNACASASTFIIFYWGLHGPYEL